MDMGQLAIQCRPNARESAAAGWVGTRLAVRLSAPAAEGRANREAVALIARLADVAPSLVAITHGHGGRLKLVSLPLAGIERLRSTIPGYGT